MNEPLPSPDASMMVAPTGPPALVRPVRGRRIGGVCAGIADRYGWSRTTVRLVTALSILVPGPQVLGYVVAWIVIPSERPTR